MENGMKDKLNGFGSAFRLITPSLIAILGTLMLSGQNDIKNDVSGLKTHFVNHLMHHQDLEVGYAERITKIEGSRFTGVDGKELEQKLSNRLELYKLEHAKNYPPKWLTDQVDDIKKKTEVILEKIEKNTKR